MKLFDLYQYANLLIRLLALEMHISKKI